MEGKNVIKEELARKAGCIEEKNMENISFPAKEDKEKEERKIWKEQKKAVTTVNLSGC